MNRTTKKDNSTSSILSSSPSQGVSRISISANSSTTNGSIDTTSTATGGLSASLNNTAGTLMNGNGELIVRRSPSSSQHLQSYYTLGSPSITTSYNSEDTSDINNSSLFIEDGNPSDSLCIKVDQLQKQIESLTKTQFTQEERYKRSRQENDDLLNRIHILEDQLREIEITAETRSKEEEKRFKEAMAKQMKMKSEECEQHLHTNYQLQQDIITLQKDLIKSESLVRTLKCEKETLEAELNEKNDELTSMDEEIHKLKLTVKHLKDEENVKSNLINILNEELEENQQLNRSQSEQHNANNNNSFSSPYAGRLKSSSCQPQTSSPKQRSTSSRRSSLTSGFDDDSCNVVTGKAMKDMDLLEADLAKLRVENKRLQETNEELQAQLLNVQLEEGRSIIQEGNKSYSLADELGDIDVPKLMEALKEQQEVNLRLRQYIGDMVQRIYDNNPELLHKTIPVTESSNK